MKLLDIRKQSPKLPLTDLYAVNWADLRSADGKLYDMVDATSPSKIGSLENECDLLFFADMTGDLDKYQITSTLTHIKSNRATFNISSPIMGTNPNKYVEYSIGSTYLLSNSPMSIYSVNLNHDIVAINKNLSMNSMHMNAESSHRYNLNTELDVCKFWFNTEDEDTIDDYADSISLNLDKYLKDSRDYESLPIAEWSDENNYGVTEPEAPIVEYYLGIARVPGALKPSYMNDKIHEFPRFIDGTGDLSANGANTESYRWIRIYDGTNVSEVLKRTCNHNDYRHGVYVLTFKVRINLNRFKNRIHDIVNAYYAKYPSSTQPSDSICGDGNNDEDKDIYALRIYTPSFIMASSDAVTDFEIPVPGDSKFKFDKFIWRTPKVYKEESNLQFAIGFQFYYEGESIEFVDSSMGSSSGKNLDVLEANAENVMVWRNEEQTSNINKGPAIMIESTPITSGSFGKSTDGYIWTGVGNGIPLFGNVAYNDENHLFNRDAIDQLFSEIISEGPLVDNEDLIDADIHRYVAYIPSDTLRRMLLESQNIKVSVWTFDGSKSAYGTIRGIQNNPTFGW